MRHNWRQINHEERRCKNCDMWEVIDHSTETIHYFPSEQPFMNLPKAVASHSFYSRGRVPKCTGRSTP